MCATSPPDRPKKKHHYSSGPTFSTAFSGTGRVCVHVIYGATQNIPQLKLYFELGFIKQKLNGCNLQLPTLQYMTGNLLVSDSGSWLEVSIGQGGPWSFQSHLCGFSSFLQDSCHFQFLYLELLAPLHLVRSEARGSPNFLMMSRAHRRVKLKLI